MPKQLIMAGKQVAIVIPFHKNTLTAYEVVSLTQCRHILGKYDTIAVKPAGLELPPKTAVHPGLKIIEFDPHYFAGIAGYNRLMLSAEFYNQFLDYEYILIYQLDAFVFKDDLNYWCSQKYDYIGAPWIRKHKPGNIFKSTTLAIQASLSFTLDLKKNGVPNKYQFENKVGNGGFSLRRVQKFYDACVNMTEKIDYYLSHTAHQYNEDAFWGLEVNRNKKTLNIPPWQIALKFAIETYPQQALELNQNTLPFGCHDWDRYADYWRPIFKSLGYAI